MKAHQGQVQQVLGSGQSLAASGHLQGPHIMEQCQKLEGCWAELEQACEARAQCLQQAVTFQQVGCREHRVRARGKSWAGSVSETCKTWDSLGGGSVVRTLGQELTRPCMAQKPLCSDCWIAWHDVPKG